MRWIWKYWGDTNFSDWKINLKNTFAICYIAICFYVCKGVYCGQRWCVGWLAHIHREMRQLKGWRIARHISQPPPGSVCLPTRFYMGMQIKPVISLACFTLAKRIRTLSLKMETIASAFFTFCPAFFAQTVRGRSIIRSTSVHYSKMPFIKYIF